MRNFYQKRNRELIIPLSVCSKDTSPVNFGLAGVFVRPSLWLLYIRQSNQYILPLCPVAFSFLQILGQKHIPYKSLTIFALFPYDIFYNSKPLNLFFLFGIFFFLGGLQSTNFAPVILLNASIQFSCGFFKNSSTFLFISSCMFFILFLSK